MRCRCCCTSTAFSFAQTCSYISAQYVAIWQFYTDQSKDWCMKIMEIFIQITYPDRDPGQFYSSFLKSGQSVTYQQLLQ